MKVGLIGLEDIGEIISHRMVKADIEVWGHREDYEKANEAYENGYVSGVNTTLKYLSRVIHHQDSMVGMGPGIFMIVKPKEDVEETLNELLQYTTKGDIIIINDKSFNLKESTFRTERLSKLGIQLINCDTSDDNLIVSGSKTALTICSPIFKALNPSLDWKEMYVWWSR
jgi:6-phosphogluconate dehydrogenase